MNNFLTNGELVIGKKYKLYTNKKLGNGGFGDIYKGEKISNRKSIAIKCEIIKNEQISLLKEEITSLYYLQGGIGIPKLYDYKLTSKYNFMMLELLGLNLDELFRLCHKKFSKNTILSLGLQMLDRLEFIHSRHIIHRDVKPENFLIGRGNKKSIVYLCDFGLAKRFRDKKTGMHIPYKEDKKFTGTACYASVYTHLGSEQSRRDDLESLAYILIYFSKGTLPWKGIKTKNKSEKQSKILSKKINTRIEDLCSGLPEELSKFLQSIRDLQFDEKPDYDFLRDLLNKMNTDKIPLNRVKYVFIDVLEKKHNINKKLLLVNNNNENNIININMNQSHKNSKSNTNHDSHEKAEVNTEKIKKGI